MTKNPLYNAILAAGYITLIASVMFYAPKWAPANDTVLVPIAILSLFVLSAAVMGFIFFYHPILMYVEGEKGDAVLLFLKTIGYFAGITIALLIALFAISRL